MTVASTRNKVTYSGNGSTRSWPFSFNVPDASYMHVIITNSDGGETTLSSGYSVDLDASTVTYPVDDLQDPLAEGNKITLMREVPITQDMDLMNQGNYDAESLERAYDKLTMIAQQLKENIDRAITVSVSSADDDKLVYLANALSAVTGGVGASGDVSYLLNAMQAAVNKSQQAADEAQAHEQSVSTTASTAIETINNAKAEADAAISTVDEKVQEAQTYADNVANSISTHNSSPTAHSAAITSQVMGVNLTVDDSTVPASNDGTLVNLLSELANRIKQIKGTSTWRDDGATTAALNLTVLGHTSTLSSHTSTLSSHTSTLSSHTSSINTINTKLNGGARSMASAGYIKLDNNHGNVIFQWGSASGSGRSGFTFNFPITFPHAGFCIAATQSVPVTSTSISSTSQGSANWSDNGETTNGSISYIAIGY